METRLAHEIRRRIALPDDLEPVELNYIVSRAESPNPFIEPPIGRVHDDDEASATTDDRGEVDVLLIDARAAVGKTTFARWLASETRAPLLDLAITPVGAQTARGILPRLRRLDGSDDNLYGEAAFENGQMTIIIDAVDEGRLRSGEDNVEAFLEDLWNMLRNRQSRARPGVVFLGRPESIELVKLAILIEREDSNPITFESYTVQFFDEASARQLVLSYARKQANAPSGASQHDLSTPVHDLLDSYFAAVGEALGIEAEALWQHEDGHQFAGYSPVLRTLGEIVGGETNHARLAARLDSGRSNAWAIIEDVCQTVFDREQDKLRQSLISQVPGALVPKEAYDRREQVRAIMAYLQGRRDVRTQLAQLGFDDPAVRAQYYDMVNGFISNHPFCDQTSAISGNAAFSNPILGAILIAEAMMQDVDFNPNFALFKGCGRQNFLWQAIKHRWERDREHEPVINLIRGKYFGLVADSFGAAHEIRAGSVASDKEQVPERGISSIRLRTSDLGLQLPDSSNLSDTFIAVSFSEPGRAERDVLELIDAPHLGPEIRSLIIDLPDHDVLIEGTPQHQEVRFLGLVRVTARAIRFINCASVVGAPSAIVELRAESIESENFIRLNNFGLSPSAATEASDDDEDPRARLYTFGPIATEQHPWLEFSGVAQGRSSDSGDVVKAALYLLLDVGRQVRVHPRTRVPRDKRQERRLRSLGDKLPDILGVLLESGFVESDNISAHGPAVLAIRTAAGLPKLIDAIDAGDAVALRTAARLRDILETPH
jgi:hypothetical protein